MTKYADLKLPSPVCQLIDPVFEQAGIQVYLKRDDLIHPAISGNKWRKLKYNLLHALEQKAEALVSFGGAFSNHLYALATVGRLWKIRTIGFVRGDELGPESSATLRHCAREGMELHFISRTAYREKEKSPEFRHFPGLPANTFLIPEGGTNEMAVRGVGEMADEVEGAGIRPDIYVVPAGTGGTAAGLLARDRKVLAVAVLKNAGFLERDIEKWISPQQSARLELLTDYHFGGYGKHTEELRSFIHRFESAHGILLEQVYTGKMMFALYDLAKRGYFARGTTLLAVHTGGLQGKLEL